VCDELLGKANPYSHTYRATRLEPTTSLPHLLKENVDFPRHLVTDRLHALPRRSPAELREGEGAILKVDGEKLAVYRDDAGQLHAVSAICTHLGCQVAFNASERSWDCPCHGSRFDVDGAVLDGPANKRLAKHLL
ncbi:MAG TPA: Rieske 2Fe-2S domain-containing protein, partial [Polyangiaceae bacterium]|nr:Rieske 2Fe-2S domain-containing protein [Polyangiaceae bacterium]